MPDITMCKGKKCPLKNECYRYTAKPNSEQYYYDSPPFETEYGMILDYTKCKKYRKIQEEGE
jgi:hypothetical protein